jgi:hypothetical protein
MITMKELIAIPAIALAAGFGVAACGSADNSSTPATTSYYQQGEAFAQWEDTQAPYVPGSNTGGVDNYTPVTPQSWCLIDGGIAAAAPTGPDLPPGPLSVGNAPSTTSPAGIWVAGCAAYITAKYGS